MKRWRFSTGFTLIELLVVIGILVLLAGLLLASVRKGLGAGETAGCVNNQRQLLLAWQLYEADHDGWIVANGPSPEGGDLRLPLWVQGAFVNLRDMTNTALILDRRYALFAPYIPGIGSYQCTADPSGLPRSYGMNAYVGTAGLDPRMSRNWRMHWKVSQIEQPDRLFVFLDIFWRSTCWPYAGVYMEREEMIYNFPATYHGQGGTVSFADGHVERKKWMDPRTRAALSPSYHMHADASPGNADVRWLRERTSVRW